MSRCPEGNSAILSAEREGYIAAFGGVNDSEIDMGSTLWPLMTFDRKAENSVVERKLPHWCQAGCLCFLTWRTFDSMPKSVLSRWHADREAWLRRHGIEGLHGTWKADLEKLDRSLRNEFVETFSERWHQHLDDGNGECPLRNSHLSRVVTESLHKFDGIRYQLTDFVVMPNHVHLLAAFKDESGMLKQCESWKHFTARELNHRLNRSDRFWQQDGFDHLVRTSDQFDAFRKYISNNPTKALLKPGEYVRFSKDLSQVGQVP